MKTYQTHDEASLSVSDTQRKLGRLQLPADLTGKRVLDIGCNEGYFSALANERGASDVIGIDFVETNIEFARQRYAREGVRFFWQGWDTLPDGPFDLVLWTSAMHYDLDPRSVFDLIADRLAPGGLLVLECGVIMLPGKEFVPVPRYADTRWYPSRDFLIDELLSEFSVRQVAEPEITEGDFVPRAVFHCRKALPVVVLLRGATSDGKSTLAERLRPAATKLVSLDILVSKMGTNRHPHDALEQFMIDHYDAADLGKIYFGIDQVNLTRQYADWLIKAVAKTDTMVVFEGYISDAQCAAIEKGLRNKAVLWDMRRVTAPA